MIYILLGFLSAHLLFARGRVTGREAFFLAERSSGGLRTSFSIAATALGASAVMGTAGWGFRFGLGGSAWLLAGSLGLLVLWILVPLIPSSRPYLTLPHLVSERSGALGRKLTALALIPPWIAITASQLRAVAMLVSPYTSLGVTMTMAIFAGFIVMYLFRGGQRAVIGSDFFQLIVLLAGLALALILLKGRGPALGDAPPADIGEHVSWVTLLPVALAYIIGPDIHSRLLSARSTASRRRGLLGGALILAMFALGVAYIGWSARLVIPDALPDAAIPSLISRMGLLPGALFNMAILAALISSTDTTLFTLSSIISVDVAGRGESLTRITLILCALVAVAVGSWGKGLIPLMLLAYELFTGVIGPTIVWSLFVKRAVSPLALIFSMSAGALTLTWAKSAGSPLSPIIAFGVASFTLVLVQWASVKGTPGNA